MRNKARVTIVDIANRAGVSFKTVSRVLNAHPGVGTDLKDRVEAAMRDLDYRPNAAARALKGGRSFAIGLLMPAYGVQETADAGYPALYVADLQRGAAIACQQAGYMLVLEYVDLRARSLGADLRRQLAHLRVDGMLMAPPVSDFLRVLDILDECAMPYARITPGLEEERSLALAIDDRAAAAAMTRLLLDRGHRRIAFVGGPADHIAAGGRLRGYRDALAVQADAEAALCVPGDFTFPSGMQAGLDLLQRADPPSAIFAANDDMAAGVLAAAGRLGVSVPRDLSVAGFDDSAMARMAWPLLTTVHQPIAHMARLAVEHLIAASAGTSPLPHTRIELPFSIVERMSVSSPRS